MQARVWQGLRILLLSYTGLFMGLIGLACLGQLLPLAPDNLISAFAFIPIFWALVLALPGLLLCSLFYPLRYTGIGLALALLSYFTLGDIYPWQFLRHTPPENSETTVRVVAANLQFYLHGIENVAQNLRDLDGDVFLLSENELTPEKEARLRLSLPDYHLYLGRYQSCALVSKEPFLWFKEVELPSYQASLGGSDNTPEKIVTKPHRAFMHGVLEKGGQQIHFISIRFIAGRPAADSSLWQKLSWGRYLLRTQTEEAAFFTDYVKRLEGPVIFGGDLNAPPRSKTIAMVNELGDDAAAVLSGLPLNTFRTQNWIPLLRLDYLYGRNGAVPIHIERSSQIFSDHYALVGQFAITPRGYIGDKLRQASVPEPTAVKKTVTRKD